MADWSRIAIRSRVPLGFIFAAAYLWLAHPTWMMMAAGCAFIFAGLMVRAAAAGHIRKNTQLATSGPYAYTRNPLYLGSILIAIGFIVASRNWWIAIATVIMFVVIYLPVIRAEEVYLRSAFPEYSGYAAHVPRLWSRFTPYRSGAQAGSPVFSRELYMRHREYNAVIGSILMLGALILKMAWYKH